MRAIYEGVAFEFKRMIGHWLRLDMEVDEVRFSGGGSKSNLWQVILANLLDLPVKRVDQGASLGACTLAGVGAGWWESVGGGIDANLRSSQVEIPTPSIRERYREYYDRYLEFYEILSGRKE